VTVPHDVEAAFTGKIAAYTRALDCVHCGLCLPSCPTYRVTGRESDSPRGRIYLMRGHAEGTIDLSAAARWRLDLCIACRNCESVCPSGIRMGDLLESYRDAARRRKGWRPFAWTGRMLLRHLIPHRGRIAAATDILAFVEWCGLRRLFRAAARMVSPTLAGFERLAPAMPPRSVRRIVEDAAAAGGFFPADGKARVRVGLFLGCIGSAWYASVHRATIRVLNRNGCDVVVPPAQTCCGALHRHAGYLDDAAALFRRNAEAFTAAGVDAVVVNAAGCGAALKEAPHELPGGFGVPVRDVLEFLDEIGIVAPGRPFPRRVAHHQACHLVHAQKVRGPVVEGLLKKVPGMTLVPLPDSDQCCGAGGIYNVLHPRMAAEVLKAKIDAVLRTGADVVLAANPGCWLQIRAGLEGHGVEVLHPIEVLDRAY
jgi:glycolate oxidase iron-sulfur subunit